MSELEKLRREREKLAAELGLLAIDLEHCRRDRDEARKIACQLLHIAECRGPKVFGPRPQWLKSEL